MAHPLNPGPSTNTASGDLPAYLSNGLVGLRVRDLPLRAGIAVVSGLSGEHPVYVGSPMLSALYGVWAAWLGDRERSLQLFEEGYGQFVQDRFLQTYEYRPDRFPEQPRAGPFVANLSGFLLGLMHGRPARLIARHGDERAQLDVAG